MKEIFHFNSEEKALALLGTYGGELKYCVILNGITQTSLLTLPEQ